MVYKLTYFNLRGRAELIRLIFAQADVEYEDIRIDGAQWEALKPTTKFGGIPQLEDDGLVVAQSGAITRYVAKKHGLAGKNLAEEALTDGVFDAISDLFAPTVTLRYGKDEKAKKEASRKFQEDLCPKMLPAFEKMIRDNGGKYMVGNGLTYADLGIYNALSGGLLQKYGCPAEVLDNIPLLKALSSRVGELPNIKKWVAKRPVTDI